MEVQCGPFFGRVGTSTRFHPASSDRPPQTVYRKSYPLTALSRVAAFYFKCVI